MDGGQDEQSEEAGAQGQNQNAGFHIYAFWANPLFPKSEYFSLTFRVEVSLNEFIKKNYTWHILRSQLGSNAAEKQNRLT